MSDANKDDWVFRVLGIRAEAGGAGSVDLGTALAAFETATETVGKQISALQQALRASGDEELEEVAEFGLNGITGNFRVRLMAAMQGARSGDARALAQLPRLAAAFRAYLDTDERVAVCDDNPFGVPVGIRAALAPVLAQLEKVGPG